ncbi:MAG: pyridoxal phosphate-dependent aminotransferase [Planctomycetales bacterium]|nr:pyridoxal phosphate-dependent aminotransferase [Planctomycetales bacterium]
MNWPRSTNRMQRVQTPMIPIVGEWIAQHPGTISLGQGIVHYDPPAEVAQAAAAAAREQPRVHRYGLVRGIPELLTALESKLHADNGIALGSRATIVTTTGSNMGFLQAVLAIADVDDEIILLSPFYFNHEMAIDIAGCRAVTVATDDDYQIDFAALEQAITPRTRAIVTVSPSNPTGAVYSQAALTRVNQLCRERQIYHISDEAYEYFVYDEQPHFSPGSLPDAHEHTISLYSLSKAYGMAGWRVGYMVVPTHLETDLKKIQDTNLVCPPIINQFAAVAALNCGREWCRQQVADFPVVREIVLHELAQLGDRCRIPRPSGAFYVLAQFDTTRTDLDLVEQLIRQFGIAVMPGSTFGTTQGCSLRIAYGALDRQTVAEGMGRLVRGLNQLLTS